MQLLEHIHTLTFGVYKTVLLLAGFLSSNSAIAQIDIPEGISISAVSTGRTTGHIATILIENKSDQKSDFVLPPCYIPSKKKHQPFIVPFSTSNIIKGGVSADTMKVYGFCTDHTTEPLPRHEALLTPDKWIKVNKVDADWQASTENGWTFSTEDDHAGFAYPLHPYHKDTIWYKLDQYKYPNEAADLFYTVILKIIEVANALSNNRELNTPYYNPNDLSKEIESVTQHSLWIYTGAIANTPYTSNRFEYRLLDQLAKAMDVDDENLKTKYKDSFLEGVQTFWNAFLKTLLTAQTIDIKE